MKQSDIDNFYMVMGFGFCVAGLLVLISFTYNFAFFFAVGTGFFLMGLWPEVFKAPDFKKLYRKMRGKDVKD